MMFNLILSQNFSKKLFSVWMKARNDPLNIPLFVSFVNFLSLLRSNSKAYSKSDKNKPTLNLTCKKVRVKKTEKEMAF